MSVSSRPRRLGLRLVTPAVSFAVGVLIASAATAATAATPARAARPSRVRLDPEMFASIADGVVRVRTFDCGGSPKAEGSGFLVGESVVMTARHVVRGACSVKVRASGKWIRVVSGTFWTTGKDAGVAEDLETLKLAAPAPKSRARNLPRRSRSACKPKRPIDVPAGPHRVVANATPDRY